MSSHVCPHSTHTHLWRTAKVSDKTHTEYTPITWKSPEFFFKTLAWDNFHTQTQYHQPWRLQQQLLKNVHLTFIQPMHLPALLVIDFGLAHRLLSLSFIHLCTKPHTQQEALLMHATKWTGWVGWIAQAMRGSWVTHPLCQCLIPETNTRHHANHAVSRTCETKHDAAYTSGPHAHFAPQLYLKTVRVCLHWRLLVA